MRWGNSHSPLVAPRFTPYLPAGNLFLGETHPFLTESVQCTLRLPEAGLALIGVVDRVGGSSNFGAFSRDAEPARGAGPETAAKQGWR